MVNVLFLLSLVALAAGLSAMTQATLGAVLVAVACWLGIWARIIQADRQQKQLARLLSNAPPAPQPATSTQGQIGKGILGEG